ncbi:hypothetical protein [Mycolicibacterium sphagni]|uniref:Secreted protein n=1 Tax=Mycolicibacterium sphagni TaxID=1786 RepID=A0ABX2JXB2_9MYCO|nr:hypothetical protein [Mycolicibacterium sphagni]NTY62363.1 hypothetical protein [Mycolicibacterium sphagni]
MWATIGEIALVSWLVIASGVIVVTYIRRSRANGRSGHTGTGHLAAVKGRYAPTPLPEWATDDQDPDSESDDRR